MSDTEGKGFVIRDRRSRADEPGSSSENSASATRTQQPGDAVSSDVDRSQSGEIPLTFSSFVFSLGTSALMFMGERLDPTQPKVPVNLSQAKEIINILSMLDEKTRGNLTSEETSVLSDMLYALRMKYVDLASPASGPGSRQATKSP